MATLRLSRRRDGGGVLRRLRVEVDGREVAGLEQRESVAVPVPAGTHVVVARMDRTSSPRLQVEVGEDDEAAIEVALSGTWDMVLRSSSALSIRRS